MELEERILRFIDCRATGEECRELLKELRENGKLGEVLLCDAAVLFMYSREELLQYFSPEEVDEIEELCNSFSETPRAGITIGQTEEPLRSVAEEEEPYNEEEETAL